MDILIPFDVAVMKASAMISSAYISAILVCSVAGSRNDTVYRQAFGFIVLFLASLLVYMVI